MNFLAQDKWISCIQGKYPAYISWSKYEENQKKLCSISEQYSYQKSNDNGPALLKGIIVCGHCNLHMKVRYNEYRKGNPLTRYVCETAKVHYGQKECSSFSGGCVDQAVTNMIFEALKPRALELSMRINEGIEQEARKDEDVWLMRLQRAKYESERAGRQYHSVEPENRLVARSLERAWNERLQEEQQIQKAYDEFRKAKPSHLTADERTRISQLASDIPKLWFSESTSTTDRRMIAQLLIDSVVVTVEHATEKLEVRIIWKGGNESKVQVERPVGKLIYLSNHKELLEKIKILWMNGHTVTEIAELLNQDGWQTPMRKNSFSGRIIRQMITRYGIPTEGRQPFPRQSLDEWTMQDFSKEIEIPIATLHTWISRGKMKVQRRGKRIVILADKQERERLKKIHNKNKRFRGKGR